MKRVGLLLALLGATPALAAPRRVVSLNLCTDQYLVDLAPDAVAALSPLARDLNFSTVARQAQSLPWVRPDAEAVLALHPDLVLAGRYGAQTTLGLLRERGLPVELIDEPRDFAAIAALTRRLADRLGVPARGAQLIATMQATLAAARPPARPVRAVFWQPHGWSAGPGTLADAVLRAAGLENAGTGGVIGLEALLAQRPDLLVVATTPGFPSLATDLLRHPATQSIPRRRLPPSLMICATPATAQAVADLAS